MPLYLLHGNESYYIDKIADFILEKALDDSQRDFNQTILYCTPETQLNDVINSVMRYPMMSDRQVVVMREAQNFKFFDKLSAYAMNPNQSTILIICHKNGTIDGRKKIVAAIQKNGVVMESNKLRDYQLPPFINDYCKRKKLTIDPKAAQMMADYVGADLNRMAGELDKLAIAIKQGQNNITPQDIEDNIGISKEYNNFELRDAIVKKDVLKANRIVNYFEKNQKNNPAILTVAALFDFFQGLMLTHYAPDKSESGLCEQLGFSPRMGWRTKDYAAAMRNYSAMKTLLIIDKIRETDARLKGIETGAATPGELLRELVFFILH